MLQKYEYFNFVHILKNKLDKIKIMKYRIITTNENLMNIKCVRLPRTERPSSIFDRYKTFGFERGSIICRNKM